jgi:hypothetical protein
MPLKNHPTDPEKYIYKNQEYNLNQISKPSTITFHNPLSQGWVMRITADRRIEVADGVDVTEAARLVLDAMQSMLDVGLEKAVLAERQWLIDSGLIGVLKHCEDLLREDGHEDAVDDVQNMIAKIKSMGQA